MNWTAPKRPVDHAEHALITAILENTFPAGSALPAERDLAAMLGVTRPTLREALRRLERDGWLIVQQGKSTVVNDFWWNGGLNILSGIVRHSTRLPSDFVVNLLQVRLDLAPSYARLAVERSVKAVSDALADHASLADIPEAFAAFDWRLQRSLTVASGNPVYALILNSFAGFYEQLACIYFSAQEARRSSQAYYVSLLKAAQNGDPDSAERVTRAVMRESISLWQKTDRDDR
jgi:GntR family negative regulator for fad regulon and positive regulator of fabA